MKKARNYLSILILFAGAICLALLLAEGALRLFVNPVDFLWPEMIQDEYLGYRIAANSAHHDAWGFRNRAIPDKADIVTLGDSQTYGNGANAESSWPAHLAQITGKTLYNLALGGYGPVQYYYLFSNYALNLNPDEILVGLYCGNDFMDTYTLVYWYDNWRELRNPEISRDESLSGRAQQIIEANKPRHSQVVRDWLAHHSVFYGVLRTFFDHLNVSAKKKQELAQNFSFLKAKEYDIDTGFKPLLRLWEADSDKPNIIEGQRIAQDLIVRMDSLCRTLDIKFAVVMIPTKELVFAEVIDKNTVIHNLKTLEEITHSDKVLRETTIAFLEEQGIEYIDPLADLQEAIYHEQIYHNNLNDHPNGNGYRIIAESVAKSLDKSD